MAKYEPKMTDNRPLTPEILIAAGWTKWHENDAVVNIEKEVDDVYFNLDFRKRIKKIDIQVDGLIKARLVQITVGEFNTLLDIVKLEKFKIINERHKIQRKRPHKWNVVLWILHRNKRREQNNN